MGLHVHRSERTDTLVAGLAEMLRDVPTDPFTPDIVAVPTRGIERFLTQSLSLVLGRGDGSDGVCANLDFSSPAALVHRVVAQASGVAADADPWEPQRCVWPLLAAIDASITEPWCSPLARHLDGDRVTRRFAVASRMAILFDSYASQRPMMIQQWAQGDDDVPPHLAWQPRLWRELRRRIALPSPAERVLDACQALAEHPDITDLPERLSVFGPTRLPSMHLHVLGALAEHREVHVWLADPSPALWTVLDHRPDALRRSDTSADVVVHPLLRSLGRDARELRLRLAFDTDEYLPTPVTGSTLLATLQRQIRDNVAPHTTVSTDSSIRIHACHGQARQAEVVREAILGLLESDPTLQPRDILIMCPDLDGFAPLLSAAFNSSTAARLLRVRIADRTPEQDNEILGTLEALLDMIVGRVEISTLLDFAARPPVRTRFRFDEEGLDRLEQLCTQAGIRWGLDEDHRALYQVRTAVGTWAWGVDRLLLGAAMSQDGLPLLGSMLPVDDVASGDVELVGALAELVTRLRVLRDALSTDRPVDQWAALLRASVTDLMAAWGPDAWQVPNALAALNTLAATADGSTTPLSLADMRWLLADLLAGRPTRTNFRSGDLTICGLAPMRSVPHRVICLVGMDDGTFPRSAAADGDDILTYAPRIGDRDRRSEDRQVLLDAVMAASDSLVITYTGADERTNDPRPPCVPLADLMDTLDAMTQGAARDEIVINQPLQPFDARNFESGALGVHGPFSHDESALGAAVSARRERQATATVHLSDLSDLSDLPEDSRSEVSARELGAFLCAPIATFLRRRLGLTLREEDAAPPERLPITLDGLQKWQIGNRTLHLLIRDEPAAQVATAERARGDLPPGALGSEVLTEIGAAATDIAARFAELRVGPAEHVPVSVDLPVGMRVVGVVPDVYGNAIVRATYSKHKPRDDLRLWPELLALAASNPGGQWHAHLVTSDGGVTLRAPGAEEARALLADLVDLYRKGLTAPLPMTPGTAQVYAHRRAQGAGVHGAVAIAKAKHWNSRYSPEGDAADVVAVWGEGATMEMLMEQRPLPDENWFDEPSRFGMLARRVWEPIFAAGGRP